MPKKKKLKLPKVEHSTHFLAKELGALFFTMILLLIVRAGSILAYASIFNIEWRIDWAFDSVPVLAFSERNIQNFEWMNTTSLILSMLVALVAFIILHRKKKLTKKKFLKHYTWYLAFFIGVLVTGVQYLLTIYWSTTDPIHFHANWQVSTFIFLALIFTVSAFKKRNKEFKKKKWLPIN